MLRKGRLYKMDIDEEVAPADEAEAPTAKQDDNNVVGSDLAAASQGKGKEKAPASFGWAGKRDRQLFEWMMGGGMTADEFFDKYWEQAPLLIQRRQDKGSLPVSPPQHCAANTSCSSSRHACRACACVVRVVRVVRSARILRWADQQG
jgi:hypothetical protein